MNHKIIVFEGKIALRPDFDSNAIQTLDLCFEDVRNEPGKRTQPWWPSQAQLFMQILEQPIPELDRDPRYFLTTQSWAVVKTTNPNRDSLEQKLSQSFRGRPDRVAYISGILPASQRPLPIAKIQENHSFGLTVHLQGDTSLSSVVRANDIIKKIFSQLSRPAPLTLDDFAPPDTPRSPPRGDQADDIQILGPMTPMCLRPTEIENERLAQMEPQQVPQQLHQFQQQQPRPRPHRFQQLQMMLQQQQPTQYMAIPRRAQAINQPQPMQSVVQSQQHQALVPQQQRQVQPNQVWHGTTTAPVYGVAVQHVQQQQEQNQASFAPRQPVAPISPAQGDFRVPQAPQRPRQQQRPQQQWMIHNPWPQHPFRSQQYQNMSPSMHHQQADQSAYQSVQQMNNYTTNQVMNHVPTSTTTQQVYVEQVLTQRVVNQVSNPASAQPVQVNQDTPSPVQNQQRPSITAIQEDTHQNTSSPCLQSPDSTNLLVNSDHQDPYPEETLDRFGPIASSSCSPGDRDRPPSLDEREKDSNQAESDESLPEIIIPDGTRKDLSKLKDVDHLGRYFSSCVSRWNRELADTEQEMEMHVQNNFMLCLSAYWHSTTMEMKVVSLSHKSGHTYLLFHQNAALKFQEQQAVKLIKTNATKGFVTTADSDDLEVKLFFKYHHNSIRIAFMSQPDFSQPKLISQKMFAKFSEDFCLRNKVSIFSQAEHERISQDPLINKMLLHDLNAIQTSFISASVLSICDSSYVLFVTDKFVVLLPSRTCFNKIPVVQVLERMIFGQPLDCQEILFSEASGIKIRLTPFGLATTYAFGVQYWKDQEHDEKNCDELQRLIKNSESFVMSRRDVLNLQKMFNDQGITSPEPCKSIDAMKRKVKAVAKASVEYYGQKSDMLLIYLRSTRPGSNFVPNEAQKSAMNKGLAALLSAEPTEMAQNQSLDLILYPLALFRGNIDEDLGQSNWIVTLFKSSDLYLWKLGFGRQLDDKFKNLMAGSLSSDPFDSLRMHLRQGLKAPVLTRTSLLDLLFKAKSNVASEVERRPRFTLFDPIRPKNLRFESYHPKLELTTSDQSRKRHASDDHDQSSTSKEQR